MRIRKFNSNEEVRDAILASACIVPPPIKLGVHGLAMDGAFSDFQILKVLLSVWSATASNLPVCKRCYNLLRLPLHAAISVL